MEGKDVSGFPLSFWPPQICFYGLFPRLASLSPLCLFNSLFPCRNTASSFLCFFFSSFPFLFFFAFSFFLSLFFSLLFSSILLFFLFFYYFIFTNKGTEDQKGELPDKGEPDSYWQSWGQGLSLQTICLLLFLPWGQKIEPDQNQPRCVSVYHHWPINLTGVLVQ